MDDSMNMSMMSENTKKKKGLGKKLKSALKMSTSSSKKVPSDGVTSH